jgi:protein TonB
LAISIAVQGAILTALILVSLFGKPQSIALANVTPVPPYSPYHNASHDSGAQNTSSGPHRLCQICPSIPISPTIPTHGPNSSGNPTGELLPPGIGDGPGGTEGLLPFVGERRGPIPPTTTETQVKRARVIRMTTINPAMLIHRVEPIYPFLPKQIHREGRVELRAIIGTDGTIQSLQVVSGDPMFLNSAIEAVQQWRYRPTILNGQPVEIDTYITVVYTLQH